MDAPVTGFQGGTEVMKVSSYTASGLATGNLPAMTMSIKGAGGTTKVTKRYSNQNKKKQLNYNPRELSSAILRAKKSLSASKVTAMAQSKLISLSKCKGTGQYNDAEVNMAIAHAKRMVRCAKMKTQNLLQEERSKKRYEREAKEELRQEKNEIKARAARKEYNLEQKTKLERMQRIQKQKSQRRELMRKKKFHRSQERSKLNEADMDYLKQQLRGLREPYRPGAVSFSGATLDLSSEAMQLAEIQMEQKLLEQQVEQQIAVSGSEGMGATGSIAGVESMPATGVDITI